MEKPPRIKVVFVYVPFAALELSFDDPFVAVFEAFPRELYCNHYCIGSISLFCCNRHIIGSISLVHAQKDST